MTLAQAQEFLNALQTKRAKPKGLTMIVASCPLARWLHKSAEDKTPSFALFVKDGGRSNYHCFACGSGSAEELIGALELYLPNEEKGDYDFAFARSMLDGEMKVMPLPEYGTVSNKIKLHPWPLWWLDSFSPVSVFKHATDYLDSRRVTSEEALKYNLRFDTQKQMIVFPFFTAYSQFAGARGRSVMPTGFKHYDYSSAEGNGNTKLVWFNEESLNLDGPVVIVEGQFDVLRVAKCWPKVVGNMTAMPTEEKFRKLSESSSIVQIPDNDEAGGISTDKYRELAARLGLKFRVAKLHPSLKDAGEAPEGYLKDLIEQTLYS